MKTVILLVNNPENQIKESTIKEAFFSLFLDLLATKSRMKSRNGTIEVRGQNCLEDASDVAVTSGNCVSIKKMSFGWQILEEKTYWALWSPTSPNK